MKMMTKRSYSEMIKIGSFEDRFKYLQTTQPIGLSTFGGHRYLNQVLYSSQEWKKVRQNVILRDNGCDLAHEDYPIYGSSVYIHHINPITIEDILNKRHCVFDMENLVCVSFKTHNAIHYSNDQPYDKIAIRSAGDTCLWR